MASREATANSGVPMKTRRKSLGIQQIFFSDEFEMFQCRLPTLADIGLCQSIADLLPQDRRPRQPVKTTADAAEVVTITGLAQQRRCEGARRWFGHEMISVVRK